MVDLGSPYVLKHAALTDTFFLKAPELVLRSRFKDIQPHCAVARPIGSGMGRIAADLIASLNENASEAGEQGAACLATQILDILAIAFEAVPTEMPEGPSLARAAVRKRALAYIDRRISDPTLDPAAVAAATGVSMRYLHKVFESSEKSVSAHIRAGFSMHGRTFPINGFANGRFPKLPSATVSRIKASSRPLLRKNLACRPGTFARLRARRIGLTRKLSRALVLK
jgi:hypothetical protein